MGTMRSRGRLQISSGGWRLGCRLLPLAVLVAGCLRPSYVTIPVRIGDEELSPVAKLVVRNRTDGEITVLKRELCAAQELFSEEDPLPVPPGGQAVLALQAKRHRLTLDTEATGTRHSYFVVANDYVAWPPGNRASPYAVLLFENPAGLAWEVRIDLEEADLFAPWQRERTPFQPAYALVITDLRRQGAPGAAPQTVERLYEPLSCDEADTLGLTPRGCGER